MQICDMHCHLVPEVYKQQLRENGQEYEDGFPLPDWSVEAQLDFMDKVGISYSLLSLSSPHPYTGDQASCDRVLRRCNEIAAQAKNLHPDRLGFCAALPLPDVDSALRETAYALDVLHADGVKLPSNAHGLYLGDPNLDPLMEELDRRHALVLIHPHRPVPLQTSVFSAGPIPLYEFLADTTRAVLNMISRNIPLRYPNLKIVVPHSGSFLPNIAMRYVGIQPILQKAGMQQDCVDVKASLAKLYFDLAGNPSVELLKLLLSVSDPNHILYGGDFPYTPADGIQSGLNRMLQEFSQDPDLAPLVPDLFARNARRLLGR